MTVNTTLGKITGSKNTLNQISLALDFAASERDCGGCFTFAKEYRDASQTIYVALDELGYYDRVRL